MFQHSVWSVITAHNLTPAKRDVTTVVNGYASTEYGHYYNTPDTVVKHRRLK